MKYLTILPMVIFVFGVSAFAQSQQEMNETADKAFKKADATLNTVYKQLQAKLDEVGKKKLQEAQRAWIKFRDAECESRADEFRGGSIMPMIYAGCAERLTKARTAELKERLKGEEG